MNANTITALATSAQALLLIVAALIAWRQVRESQSLREAQAQPYVTIALESDPYNKWVVNLIIKNAGSTVARDICLDFNPPLASTLDKPGDRRMNEWTALADGIPTLVPGQEMSMLFDSLISRYADLKNSTLPSASHVTISYRGDLTAKIYKYGYDLDFNIFHGAHYVGRKGLDDIAKTLDSIRKTHESWTTQHGVKVYTKNYDEHVVELTAQRGTAIAEYNKIVAEQKDAKRKAEGTSAMPEQAITTSERSAAAAFTSLDGLTLRGTLVVPATATGPAAVLVHGGGVTREEGGFYARLATGLADVGAPSLRFDFRGHGESDGRQEDLTLSGVVNDIRAAVEYVRAETGGGPVNLIGASFGGGITALYAAQHPDTVHRLVLFNPLLNYKKRFIDDKPYWHNDRIDEDEGRELAEHGFLAHSPTFKLGRPLLNEVFYLQPHRALGSVTAPTLLVHGTGDTFVPVQSSRSAVAEFGGGAELIEIDGAQHGIAVNDDPGYLDPQTQEWQAQVVQTVATWLTR